MSESDWTAGALIAEAWERHTKVLTPAEPSWCELCDEVWPCLTIRLASELNSIPSRIGSAIRATVVSRADAEYQWPTCHKAICHRDHGDIHAVFNLFAMRLKDTVNKELSCRAITEPDDGDGVR